MADKLRKWVYVSGPYTVGDPVLNTRKALITGMELWNLGFLPVVPHIALLWHLISPQSYDTWLDYDMHLLYRCDAILRLPGRSPGADKEIEFSKENDIEIFYDIESIRAHYQGGSL